MIITANYTFVRLCKPVEMQNVYANLMPNQLRQRTLKLPDPIKCDNAFAQ